MCATDTNNSTINPQEAELTSNMFLDFFYPVGVNIRLILGLLSVAG